VAGSRYISGKQATAYLQAMLHDRENGKKLNLAVTLNFSCTNSPAGSASYAMQRLVSDRFGRWFRYQSQKAIRNGKDPYGPAIYTWVAEAKAGKHFHWCIYMPEELRKEFEKKLPRWISDTVGEIKDLDGCINIKDIYGVMGIARYCMKGISPIQAGRRHIRPEEQGIVYGKRVAISRSLGKKARARALKCSAKPPVKLAA